MRVARVACRTTFMVYIFLMAFSFQTVMAKDYVTKRFEWSYEGLTWTWDLQIPLSSYRWYRGFVPQYERVKRGVEGYAHLVTTEDPFMRQVAEGLHRAARSKGYNYYKTVNFVLAFVQSLPYVCDRATTGYSEYPRFPIETLMDGGDCEDTSILFATLLKILNYDVVLISLPDHMAVGVQSDEVYYRWLSRYYKSYTLGCYYYKGRWYCYCETTDGMPVMGIMPPEYLDVRAIIIPLRK